MSQLAEQGGAAGAVVGTDEYAARIARVFVGEGASVVVGTEQDALFAVGMPLDDEVAQAHGAAGFRMAGIELLQRDAGTELFEMGLQVGLLPAHALGAADARADGTNFLEILIGAV